MDNTEKEKLFRQLKHSLGAPIRTIELEDEMLCTLLEMVIEDYSQYVQDFLIENQWVSLYGQNISTTDMAFALSVRSTDYMTQFTYAYSKQVGLQNMGPWELKKDFITLESGKQVYQIPANRQINQVLWLTPPTTNLALLSNFNGFDFGFGGGYAQIGSGAAFNGGTNSGYYIAPAFDTLLMAADMNLKNRLIRSDLVYKVTAGPEGTRLLHLISTPGSKFTLGSSGASPMGYTNLSGCYVWYHYYDTANADVDKCKKENPDIILLPNDVPLSKLQYDTFNEPTKTLIRQLFIAEAKKTLGRVRGKFGGIVGPPEAERTMDYDTLLQEGNEEKKVLLEKLTERLKLLSTTNQLEKAANESEYLNKHLRYRPLGFYVK